ncbi:alginate O-acetyltransferase AlgX-related protein [Halomonas sp. AOP1-B1-8]|uniref:alginate O-acetyltransferase AlgX-related protein n=1 Tax=unclassified Halomonas TaxID=2609666 RepID=UPI003F925E5D
MKSLRTASNHWLQQVKKTVISHRGQRVVNQGLRWHLDYPSLECPPWLNQNGWVVQGWVLLPSSLSKSMEDVRVIARWNSVFELCHPLSLERPDVIETVLGEDPTKHPQLRCGFRFTVPRQLTSCTLELCVNGERIPLPIVSMPELPDSAGAEVAPLKVLKGKANWLFLDNDTNGSVDQYRGCLLLTDEGVKGWQRYFKDFYALAEKHGAASAVLVAPAKESVMGPRYHPYAEGAGGPIQQLLALPEAQVLVYPVQALMALGDDAFIQTDTHWTQRGAMAASKVLAAALGLDDRAVENTFVDDEYDELSLTGDLGSKLKPKRTCRISSLRTFNYHQYRCFDNGLPNFGRLVVLANGKALMPGTCLIFGSSSSYSMFNYVSRLFKRVVFVHSAGSLDPELVAAVKPDYLVVQTNARFVVQVPKVKQSLTTLIAEKRERLTEEEQEVVAKRQVLVTADDAMVTALGISPWVSL